MDFFRREVLALSLEGELVGSAGAGAPGLPDAERFGSVADAAFRGSSAFLADGDGGAENRVARWRATPRGPGGSEWVSPALPAGRRRREEFSNPHSVCWHEASDSLLVADRDNARIAVLEPGTGAVRGSLGCDGLQLGARGKPFGVRTLRSSSAGLALDLLFVAVANNPQDGKNQFVHVVDMSSFARSGRCEAVLQSVALDAALCRTPHLMGVDEQTAEVYVACVGEPGSTVLRLRPRPGPGAEARPGLLVA